MCPITGILAFVISRIILKFLLLLSILTASQLVFLQLT